ncbi:hypothetical protein N0V82_000785 [Gnomoniopsis sp. IMI 355080]|nr:hypothetical protein N0V82_000785 [Gnomoniopsis sp. IMI 355080]
MSEVVHPGSGSCPLIDNLPTEIRIQIYEYILFENGSFFALDDEEGNSVPTLFPKLRAPPKRRGLAEQENGEARAISRGPRKGNIMSLLLTNKQIYNESAALLYSTSFFRLRGINSTIQFINNVSPAHLALVRSLKLVWDDQGWTSAPEYDTPTLRAAWPSFCDALASDFPSLRNLYVALGMPSNEAHIEELYLGANGLGRVGHVADNFKVCIPVGILARHYGVDKRRGTAGAKGVGDAPFTLCRHTAGEVCNIRREVITAEWLGESRPSTPKLRVNVPNVPGLEPWADGVWEEDEKARI